MYLFSATRGESRASLLASAEPEEGVDERSEEHPDARERAGDLLMTVDHIGLSVADLERMTTWWSTALNATIEYTFERADLEMHGVMLRDADGFRLELLHRRGSSPGHAMWSPGDSLLAHGFGHVALQVQDVPAGYQRLIAHGAAAVAAPAPGVHPGTIIAFVADPESNLVEIISR